MTDARCAGPATRTRDGRVVVGARGTVDEERRDDEGPGDGAAEQERG